MGIFFPNSWKIDENTHIFPTHGFWEIFPVQNGRYLKKKKALKLLKFQKLISQEPFRVRWKNFAHFCFLLVGTFEQNLIKIWEYGWHGCPSLMWNHPLFNQFFPPKLHCSNENHIKKIMIIFLSLLLIIILTLFS